MVWLDRWDSAPSGHLKSWENIVWNLKSPYKATRRDLEENHSLVKLCNHKQRHLQGMSGLHRYIDRKVSGKLPEEIRQPIAQQKIPFSMVFLKVLVYLGLLDNLKQFSSGRNVLYSKNKCYQPPKLHIRHKWACEWSTCTSIIMSWLLTQFIIIHVFMGYRPNSHVVLTL